MTVFEIQSVRNLTKGKRLSRAIVLLVLTTVAAFGAADLLPQSISVSPATVTAGNTVTVTYTVRNQGDTNAPASQTKIQIKDSADVLVVEQNFTMPAINANSAVSESREATIPAGAAAGPYKAFIIVDNRTEVADGGTIGNDQSAGTAFAVQARPASAADVRPQKISVSPATVIAGNTVTVTYTVRNQGDTNAPASHTKIQIKDSADVLMVAESFTMTAINANSAVSESREVTIPAGAAAGAYKAFIIVDNNSEVADGGTTGNDQSAGTAFTVSR